MIDTRGLDAAGREVLIDYLSTKAEDELIVDSHRKGGAVVVSTWCPQELVFHLADDSQDAPTRHGTDDDGTKLCPKGLPWLRRQILRYFSYRWTQFHLENIASSHHRPAATSSNFGLNESGYDVGGDEHEGGCGGARGKDAPDDVAATVYQFLSQEVGMPSLVERYGAQLLDGIQRFREKDLSVQIFGVLLHSQAYTTSDIRAFLSWHSALQRYAIAHLHDGSPQQFLKLRDVPYLLRRLLLRPTDVDSVADASAYHVNERRPLIPSVKSRATWERCRAALDCWCDSEGRVPGNRPLVSYVPPFPDSPYVGRKRASAKNEGRFRDFKPSVLVHVFQVLTLMLLNWKAARTGCIPI
jgi:hypothetical protein